MGTFARSSASLGLVGVVALAALRCNAVLGIDEAEVDPTFVAGARATGGTAGSAGTGNSTNYSGTHLPIGCIEPASGCTDCLKNAGFDESACLSDPACRKALDDYRVCLGDACTGSENCLEELLYPIASELAALSDECRTVCGEKPLYTQCELYCACMDHNCAGTLGATGDACVTQCMAGDARDPGIAYCRKSHCEFAGLSGIDTVSHCEHARGINACATVPMPDATCDRVLTGFPCSDRSDCCSNNCSNQVCL